MGPTSSNSRIYLSIAAFVPQSGDELKGAVDACLKVQKPETQIVLFEPSFLSRIRQPSITHYFSAIGRNIELRRGEKVGPFANVGTTTKRLPWSCKINATVLTEAHYWHSHRVAAVLLPGKVASCSLNIYLRTQLKPFTRDTHLGQQ